MKTSLLLGFAALLAALAAAGCSAGASPRPEIQRSMHDQAIWVRPDDIDRYVCKDGVFFCEDGVGRTSARLCRCLAQ